MDCFSRDIGFSRIEIISDSETLRSRSEALGQKTRYGSLNFITKVRNRSASDTYLVATDPKHTHQQHISESEATAIVESVCDYLKDRDLVQVDRRMGSPNETASRCRLLVTAPYVRLAYMWSLALFPCDSEDWDRPDFVTIYVPEWKQRQIIVHPDAGVTYILGTDYFGEAKKSFLRMQMYRQKQRGYLGFHAASKIMRVIPKSESQSQDVGFLIFGLSGTGKTTLSTYPHSLDGVNERAIVRQDDVVIMDDAGVCFGTEDGFFIKTEGLSDRQPTIFEAVRHPRVAFENVFISSEGVPVFSNESLTSNGRAVIPRSVIPLTDDEVDLQRVHNLVFITRRRDILPPVARLSPEQAAAYFMLGESVETSAGDPKAVGQARRAVGTNPFIIGSEAEEGNWLLRFLRNNPKVKCYLLNTGSVGEQVNIDVEVSASLIEHIARDAISWQADSDWGYEVPVSVPGIDIERYHPTLYYSDSEYRLRIEKLRNERLEWLSQFIGLNPAIIACVEPERD